jgi:hypothetical protein
MYKARNGKEFSDETVEKALRSYVANFDEPKYLEYNDINLHAKTLKSKPFCIELSTDEHAIITRSIEDTEKFIEFLQKAVRFCKEYKNKQSGQS